jgi:hypothetical protein
MSGFDPTASSTLPHDRPCPSYRARGLAAAVGLIGTVVGNDYRLTSLGLVTLIVALTVAGRAAAFVKFAIAVLVPVGLVSVLVWGVLVKAAPGDLHRGASSAGYAFTALVVARLATIAAVTQLTVLTLSPSEWPAFLRSLGVRGVPLIAALGAMVALPELRIRAQQVVEARMARGKMTHRGLVDKARQFPQLLRPLVTWSLRTALHRSQMWVERGIVDRLDCLAARRSPSRRVDDIALLMVAVVWFILQCATRVT